MGSAQTAQTNVVYSGTQDPKCLPVTLPLINQSLLNQFIKDDLLHEEYYDVTSTFIMQSAEIDFAQLLHDIDHRFRNNFSKEDLVNCLKQVLTDAKCCLPETDINGLS